MKLALCLIGLFAASTLSMPAAQKASQRSTPRPQVRYPVPARGWQKAKTLREAVDVLHDDLRLRGYTEFIPLLTEGLIRRSILLSLQKERIKKDPNYETVLPVYREMAVNGKWAKAYFDVSTTKAKDQFILWLDVAPAGLKNAAGFSLPILEVTLGDHPSLDLEAMKRRAE